MELQSLLNERKWSQNDLDALTLAVRHRGAPEDMKQVGGDIIHNINNNGLVVYTGQSSWQLNREGMAMKVPRTVFIPWHRVLNVRDAAGELVWNRS
jgi:uncharacterized protein (UPF0248 family)